MSRRLIAVQLIVLCAALTVACPFERACDGPYHLERSFLRAPIATRIERMRQQALPDQYKIFRYGMDRSEPPLMDLADPIAERGRTAIPFLLEQLSGATDDRTVDDVLLIFEAMARLKTYDVHADSALMTTLTARVSAMTDGGRKREALRTLASIKELS